MTKSVPTDSMIVHVQIDPLDWTTIDSLRAKNTAQSEGLPGVAKAVEGEEADLSGECYEVA